MWTRAAMLGEHIRATAGGWRAIGRINEKERGANMNGYERAFRTLSFEETDCVPTWGGYVVSADF